MGGMFSSLTTNFPSELVSNKEKDNIEYGLKYASAIYDTNLGYFQRMHAEIKENRKYAEGKHPIDDCKRSINKGYIKDEKLYIDWDNKIQFLPTLLRRAANGIQITEFSTKAFAIDPTAMEERNAKKQEKLKLFHAKDFIGQLTQATGQSPVPPEIVPQSMEQIELEQETDSQLKYEKAAELLIDSIQQNNNTKNHYDDLKWDIFVDGIGVYKVETNSGLGITSSRVDASTFIHKPSSDKFLSDSNYFGEIRQMTVRELRRIMEENDNPQIKISDDDIREMLNKPVDYEISGAEIVEVLEFTFLTFREKVYKKKRNRDTGTVNMIDRTKDVGTDKEYNPKGESDISTKIRKTYDVWYEGIMTLGFGDRKIIKYELAENMINFNGQPIPKYICVAPRVTKDSYNSLARQAIPRIKELQTLYWRIQHFRNRLKGNKSVIDPDSLSGVKLGTRELSSQEVLEYYFAWDIIFSKSLDSEGFETRQKRGVQEEPTGIPYSLQEMARQFASELSLLQDIFGVPNADEGKGNPDTMVDGEVYRMSDNLTLRDYPEKLLEHYIRVLQVYLLRAKDIFRFTNLKNKYIGMIGTDDMEAFEALQNEFEGHSFAMFMDIIPTRAERIGFIQSINSYAQAGLLDPVDAEELKTYKNIKAGLKILRMRIKERQTNERNYELQKSEQNQNGNIAAIEASKEKELMLVEANKAAKLELAQASHLQKMEIIYYEMQQQSMVVQDKKEHQMAMEQLRQEIITKREMMKKDVDRETALERQRISNANQSLMIRQRQEKGDVIPVAKELFGSMQQEEVDLSELNQSM